MASSNIRSESVFQNFPNLHTLHARRKINISDWRSKLPTIYLVFGTHIPKQKYLSYLLFK